MNNAEVEISNVKVRLENKENEISELKLALNKMKFENSNLKADKDYANLKLTQADEYQKLNNRLKIQFEEVNSKFREMSQNYETLKNKS